MKKSTVKKTILLTMALLTILALFAGCGSAPASVTNQSVANASASAAPSVSASAAPSVSASANKVFTLGITQIVTHPSLDLCRTSAIEELKAKGFVEGTNLKIDFQNASGDVSVATTIAQQFVTEKADVIMAIATPTAQAAYAAAMNKIPIVFSAVSAPSDAGLANKDGSNLKGVTGTSDALPIDATLKLIKALVPNAKNIGILHNTGEVNSDVQLKQAQEAAPNFGMQVIDAGITSTNEISSALDTLLPKVDVVMNLTDNMVVSSLALEVQKCNAAKKPLFGSEDTQVTNGALASAGIDYGALGKATGDMIAQILQGTPAESIPIMTSSNPMITINSDQVAALGITVPEDMKSSAKTVTTAKS